MRHPIKDEFENLPISRQRKYQLRMKRAGRCIKCGEPTEGATLCPKHIVKHREYSRQRLGLKRRYYNAASYRAAGEASSDPGLACNSSDPAVVRLDCAVPQDHPLRAIKLRVNRLLCELAPGFDEARRNQTPPFVAPEHLLKSWVLITLYSVPTPRLFCELLPFNLLWLWFLDLPSSASTFAPEAFEQQYRSLLENGSARRFRERLFGHQPCAPPTEPVTVDPNQATLNPAWKNEQNGVSRNRPQAA